MIPRRTGLHRAVDLYAAPPLAPWKSSPPDSGRRTRSPAAGMARNPAFFRQFTRLLNAPKTAHAVHKQSDGSTAPGGAGGRVLSADVEYLLEAGEPRDRDREHSYGRRLEEWSPPVNNGRKGRIGKAAAPRADQEEHATGRNCASSGRRLRPEPEVKCERNGQNDDPASRAHGSPQSQESSWRPARKPGLVTGLSGRESRAGHRHHLRRRPADPHGSRSQFAKRLAQVAKPDVDSWSTVPVSRSREADASIRARPSAP